MLCRPRGPESVAFRHIIELESEPISRSMTTQNSPRSVFLGVIVRVISGYVSWPVCLLDPRHHLLCCIIPAVIGRSMAGGGIIWPERKVRVSSSRSLRGPDSPPRGRCPPWGMVWPRLCSSVPEGSWDGGAPAIAAPPRKALGCVRSRAADCSNGTAGGKGCRRHGRATAHRRFRRLALQAMTWRGTGRDAVRVSCAIGP